MSDEFTPRGTCPVCKPEADFALDWTITASYCYDHNPATRTEDDARFTEVYLPSAYAESDGDTNRAWARMLSPDREEC